jgi:hypothetical protein
VRCASDAYKMDLNANIDQNGTAFSGNWFASQYRQGAKFQGKTSRVLSRRSRERYDRRLADSSHKKETANRSSWKHREREFRRFRSTSFETRGECPAFDHVRLGTEV